MEWLKLNLWLLLDPKVDWDQTFEKRLLMFIKMLKMLKENLFSFEIFVRFIEKSTALNSAYNFEFPNLHARNCSKWKRLERKRMCYKGKWENQNSMQKDSSWGVWFSQFVFQSMLLFSSVCKINLSKNNLTKSLFLFMQDRTIWNGQCKPLFESWEFNILLVWIWIFVFA